MDNQEKNAQAPLLFLVFNRPDTTEQVLKSIRLYRPERLYVACDGPRVDRPGEEELVGTVQRIISEGVDWPCSLFTLYRDTNLGCKKAVSSALDWFFENEEAGIVLEDDCLPHPDFWRYCNELLVRYANDERVFMISGNNFQDGKKVNDDSYYVSALTHIWGWASWRRSWQKVDLELGGYDDWVRHGGLQRLFGKGHWVGEWKRTFKRYRQGRYNTWDYPFLFAAWKHGQYALLPSVNLVSNIGFGHQGATHTSADVFHGISRIPTGSLNFPLRPPKAWKYEQKADIRTLRIKMFPSPALKIWRLLIFKLNRYGGLPLLFF
ncbi:MAG: glycosyltransferase family A protein [Bacteroidia bacterium]